MQFANHCCGRLVSLWIEGKTHFFTYVISREPKKNWPEKFQTMLFNQIAVHMQKFGQIQAKSKNDIKIRHRSVILSALQLFVSNIFCFIQGSNWLFKAFSWSHSLITRPREQRK